MVLSSEEASSFAAAGKVTGFSFPFRRSSMGSGKDEPPNSRLFIIGSKNLTEDDFRKAFEEFGSIEEVWVVKDKNSGDSKGIAYVKYAKTSEAARALEAMNGKHIAESTRSIRVMIAASREQGSMRDMNEEERTQRLFVMVPKTMTELELYTAFKEYGDIDYANIVRDRESRESKGFAYVKYYKFTHAAAAFEQCDKKFKAVFAEPRKSSGAGGGGGGGGGLNNRSNSRSEVSDRFSNFGSSTFKTDGFPPPPATSGPSYTKLVAIVSPQVNQDQLWRLFDIIPGLDYCHLRLEGRPTPVRGVASVVYTDPRWAAHACEKIHGLEYPLGHRIIVKPDPNDDGRSARDDTALSRLSTSSTGSSRDRKQTTPDLLQIAETIARASSMIQAAGLSPDMLHAKLGLVPAGAKEDDVLCNIKLPDAQPLADPDADTVARCFIVCSPNPPPNHALKDVFSRFGNLIDVYMLSNRNCGYAKYANEESAKEAIAVLHGTEICGMRMKVLEAEERRDSKRKRQKVELVEEQMDSSF